MRTVKVTVLLILFVFAGCDDPSSSEADDDVLGCSAAAGCDAADDTGVHMTDAITTGADASTASDTVTDSDAETSAGAMREIASGRHHTCVMLDDSALYCWGQGAFRALGGDYDFQGTPRLVEAISDATLIASGTKFGCAVRLGGSVWCWGENDHGQVGENATVPCGDCTPLPACASSICVPTPQPMAGLEGSIVDLALGQSHGCALRDDGQVLCWGDNSVGQLGLVSPVGDVPTPQPVPGVAGATHVTAGFKHSCALIGSPGTVMCWGQNDRAQVGNGDVSEAVYVPSLVANLVDAVEIIGGGSHTCARRATGEVVCWGYNYLGSLGNGSTRPTRASSIETVVGLDDAEALAAGQYFTCALRSTGSLVCWGDNRHGQLGDGTSTGADCAGRPCRTVPTEVLSVQDVALVNAGELHACAASAAGTLWCWGYNLGGQLGTGGVSSDPTPTPAVVGGLPD